METQKIINLLNGSENGYSNLQQKMICYQQWIKRCLFTQKSNQILTSTLQSSFCDYSDVYILVSGNIAVVVVF